MMRLACAAALCAIASSNPALAEPGATDDPAVLVCEAVIRQPLPGTTAFERRSVAVEGSAAVIAYRTVDLAGFAKTQTRRCAFVFDRSKGTWSLRDEQSAEATRCMTLNDEVQRVVRARGADAARPYLPRMELCAKILKAELAREAPIALARIALVLRGGYPIAAPKTALREAP